MKAVLYNPTPRGWLVCHFLRRRRPALLTSRLNGFHLKEMPPPALPGDDWVRVRTLLGGICGSDAALAAHSQPVDSILGAFISMPFIPGHENVAVVEEVGRRVDRAWIGRRVCVEPTLACAARGIEPPCHRCAAGQSGTCESFGDSSRGRYKLPPGTSIGYNSRTGGSWGERFVAHESQLLPVPDALSDEDALLTDPLACALHAALRADLSSVASVLVYGAGVMGLGVLACLRATGFAGRIDVADRSARPEARAKALGASDFLLLPEDARERYRAVARRTGATLHEGRLKSFMLCGGYDAVFECVGLAATIAESLRWARSGGQVVMVGTGHGRGADLTAVWFRELTVLGACGRGVESLGGRRASTYQLVHELMTAGKLPVRPLLTHTFRVEEYRKALEASIDKDRYEAVKVALDFR